MPLKAGGDKEERNLANKMYPNISYQEPPASICDAWKRRGREDLPGLQICQLSEQSPPKITGGEVAAKRPRSVPAAATCRRAHPAQRAHPRPPPSPLPPPSPRGRDRVRSKLTRPAARVLPTPSPPRRPGPGPSLPAGCGTAPPPRSGRRARPPRSRSRSRRCSSSARSARGGGRAKGAGVTRDVPDAPPSRWPRTAPREVAASAGRFRAFSCARPGARSWRRSPRASLLPAPPVADRSLSNSRFPRRRGPELKPRPEPGPGCTAVRWPPRSGSARICSSWRVLFTL
ncbi:PREDICTED: basic proline-rich protein-like [Chinchilla lanigera]|uniref:basic proline-rich protein-like n=1 Tax=Chinchilla lanigera TaxID=34839 RepID=UPI00069680EA|nr:PREDICTED: basic proline-rich protein-like [Chinchilla lanigera]